MPLRPIDAIFVHPKQRLYVVYYRGELWQLPRMKIDDRSWQNRRPYTDDSSSLYLSIHQAINDPILAQKLRTLDLPVAVRGSTLPRFEAWWEAHGFRWLKDRLLTGESPLAAHQTLKSTTPASNRFDIRADYRTNSHTENNEPQLAVSFVNTDIFADMLAELTDEVLETSVQSTN
ncbi:hypothetical protein [Psychrobacter proteolyticus]|uniref:hypothetical protein n=1 Tax=Psychrobacter proteolyticus TaxID=147825 RepID=UPI000E0A8990|nr:hypothetical protein [Psychrobacter proteolyticus]